MTFGIDCLRFYTPSYYLDLKELARQRQVDPGKYFLGLGQERMALPPPDEDIITMSATAAAACLKLVDRQKIGMVIVATESALDQSKAAALHVHKLLQLPRHCQAVEIKQACCGSSLALQFAMDRVRSRPQELVLVIASDISRYGLCSAGEPTQGAAAAAFIVSAQPRLLELEKTFGAFTEDVRDFWRPIYRDAACVDGAFSIRMYLKALLGAWHDYGVQGGASFSSIKRFCYHQPFTRMAYKAHHGLMREAGIMPDDNAMQVEAGLLYNRQIGNSYTASLYISLASLLELTREDLSNQRIACFAYGSGCTGLFFGGTVVPGYRDQLAPTFHQEQLGNREQVDWSRYEEFYRYQLPQDGSERLLPEYRGGGFRLVRVGSHIRYYEPRAAAAAEVNRLSIVA